MVHDSLRFLNPKQTDRFRDRHRMSSSRSDGFDAYVLADAVRTDPHLFNALSALDEKSLALRVLTRTREGTVQRKVAISNELTSALKRYFPLALELFSGLDSAEAVGFLSQYPRRARCYRGPDPRQLQRPPEQEASRISARHRIHPWSSAGSRAWL